ncbi:VWA domain-containing protein [Corynebacterium diphtheriae]|nr:VWA domain-containing protein [Corynebacterium diphtheriae]CAB0490780.1 VWA domain-containing protein [Corynebacterium diphtheriae]CAB0922384.1 VWA domain-containing protein [Corynebacterium diphtheriae]CAB0976136.1 VWA domain-containing protein [Corynebacterium diphtheriae]
MQLNSGMFDGKKTGIKGSMHFKNRHSFHVIFGLLVVLFLVFSFSFSSGVLKVKAEEMGSATRPVEDEQGEASTFDLEPKVDEDGLSDTSNDGVSPHAFRAGSLGREQLVSRMVEPSRPAPYQYPNLYEYAVSVDKKGKANQISLSGDFRLSQQTFDNYAGYFKLYINQQQVSNVEWDVEDGRLTANFDSVPVNPEGRIYIRLAGAVWNGSYYEGPYSAMTVSVRGTSGMQLETIPDSPYEGPWTHQTSIPNPPTPKRCGLNIALVFDVSNSLNYQDGVRHSRDAATAVISALNGTPTTLGMYAFATGSPVGDIQRPDIRGNDPKIANVEALDLSTDAGYDQAVRQIMTLRTGEDAGGTNWEAALLRVAEAKTRYDIVYFITDGVPTTNEELLPKNLNERLINGWAGEPGNVTHNVDITRGITAANAVKATGARLETLAVNLPDYGIPVLNDDVRIDSNNYRGVRPIRDKSYIFAPQESWERLTRSGYSWVQQRGESSNPLRVYFNNHDTTWSHAQSIVDKLGGADAVTMLENYAALPEKIRKMAMESCEGTVIVEKQIVDDKGEIIPRSSVEGWRFTADAVQSDTDKIWLVDENESPTDQRTTLTNIEGITQYRFKTALPHKSGSVRITETQQEGFVLHQQDGHNAKCSVGGAPLSSEQYIDDGELGFRVDISTDRVVTCVVQNKFKPTFKVEKTPGEDQNPALEGKQSRAPIDSSGKVVAYYDVKVTNNSISSSELSAPVFDTIAFPVGMSVTGVDFYYEKRKISDDSYIAAQYAADRPPLTYEIKPALFGNFKGNESKTVEVRVTAMVDESTQIEIAKEQNGNYQWCELPRPISPNNPRSMFNSVTLAGEHEPPNPQVNNQACVDPEIQMAEISLIKVDSQDNSVVLEGVEFTIFRNSGTVDAPQVGERVLTLGAQPSAKGTLSGTIPVGTYLLVETKAPVGEKGQYELLPQPVPFHVELQSGKTHITILNEHNHPQVTVAESNTAMIKVADVHLGQLPKTGGVGVGLFAAFGALLICIGILLARRKKHY